VNALAAKALFEDAVAGLSIRVLQARGWVIHSRTWPTLDISFRSPQRQELRLRLACDDWNDSPPSVDLLTPDGQFLTTIPNQRPGPTSSIFNGSAHPRTMRPFVCMIGVREYHDHPSHLTDHWANYKPLDAYTLGSIVTQLWHGWERFWP
jgi:Predicted metal binding domain